MATEKEVEEFKIVLREKGPKTFQLLLSAVIIWLFSILVFIPISSSIGKNAELVIILVSLFAFTVLISRTVYEVKNLLDVFSVFPARKFFVKRGISIEMAVPVSRLILYIFTILIFYLSYFPYLILLSPPINGIVLIIVITATMLLTFKTLILLKEKIIAWLYS